MEKSFCKLCNNNIGFIAAEPVIATPILSVLKINLDTLIKSETYALIFGSLAVSGLELLFIAFVWHLKLVILDFEKNNLKKRKLYEYLFVLAFFEMTYIHIFLSGFQTLAIGSRIMGVIGLLSIIYINSKFFVLYLGMATDTVNNIINKKEEIRNEKNDNS